MDLVADELHIIAAYLFDLRGKHGSEDPTFDFVIVRTLVHASGVNKKWRSVFRPYLFRCALINTRARCDRFLYALRRDKKYVYSEHVRILSLTVTQPLLTRRCPTQLSFEDLPTVLRCVPRLYELRLHIVGCITRALHPYLLHRLRTIPTAPFPALTLNTGVPSAGADPTQNWDLVPYQLVKIWPHVELLWMTVNHLPPGMSRAYYGIIGTECPLRLREFRFNGNTLNVPFMKWLLIGSSATLQVLKIPSIQEILYTDYTFPDMIKTHAVTLRSLAVHIWDNSILHCTGLEELQVVYDHLLPEDILQSFPRLQHLLIPFSWAISHFNPPYGQVRMLTCALSQGDTDEMHRLKTELLPRLFRTTRSIRVRSHMTIDTAEDLVPTKTFPRRITFDNLLKRDRHVNDYPPSGSESSSSLLRFPSRRPRVALPAWEKAQNCLAERCKIRLVEKEEVFWYPVEQT